MEQETILGQMNRRFEGVDKKFEAVDRRFDRVDQRFDRLEGQFDAIAIKVLEHDEQLRDIRETMVTKEEYRQDHNQIMSVLDAILKLTQKKDQELVMITHGMRRHEERVQKLEALRSS